jgi:hypothetical protein
MLVSLFSEFWAAPTRKVMRSRLLSSDWSVNAGAFLRTNQGARRRLLVRLLKPLDSCATRIRMTCDIGPE